MNPIEEEGTNRASLDRALDAVIEQGEWEDVAIRRVEIDILATGEVIYRVYPRDGSESERGVVTV